MPDTAEDLAEVLRRPALHARTILLEGNGTKRYMGGPVYNADEHVSTRAFNRVLEYEPRDLTVSVQAGVLWRDLRAELARNRQMVPLDPPFSDRATVGGVVAANCCGPRRRLYGSARDLVIGMKFATLEGRVVSSGGMVVKNVAGLDMAKLLIGSFGTLAAIVVVNFKVLPMPEVERTFVVPFRSAADAIVARDKILAGGLQPAAIDLLNPAASRVDAQSESWTLAIRACGNAKVIARCQREVSNNRTRSFAGAAQDAFWRRVEEFTPTYLRNNANGAVIRASCTLKELEHLIGSFDGPAVARAASGVCYGYFENASAAVQWLQRTAGSYWKSVIEFAAGEESANLDRWPAPGGDFEIMQRVKHLFDPGNLLNRGRLYRLI
jgi:glycolate oxidase FAD binding subunit